MTEQTTVSEFEEKLEWIQGLIDKVHQENLECKIFKLRDMHQIRASIFLLLGLFDKSLEEFEKTLHYFRIEKQQELEKQFV